MRRIEYVKRPAGHQHPAGHFAIKYFVRKLIQEDHSVSPRNLCNSLLHKCFIRISLCEFCHVFEVAHRIPLDIRERNADIGGKILYEFTPQCLAFVYHLAYMVIAS